MPKPPPGEILTEKQKRFVEEYCVDFIATQAAIRAGYSEKTAYSIGSENLRKPEVLKAIQERLDTLAMSTEEALVRYTRFARGSMSDFLVLDNGGAPMIQIPDNPEAVDLIKKVKVTENTSTSKDGDEFTTTKTEFELEDRQAAMHKILQVRGAITSKLDILNSDGSLQKESGINWDDLTDEQREQFADIARAAIA